MRLVLSVSLVSFVLVVASSSCDRAAPPTAPTTPAAPAKAQDGGAATSVADASLDLGPFVRARPQFFEVRSVDACAYVGGFGYACIDALVQELDPVRAKYMRRLSDAYARLNRDQSSGAPAHAELSDCCNAAGPCASTAKKTGHTDCPTMDDGYACLTAAEMHAMGGGKSNTKEKEKEKNKNAFHERACHCDWKRAQIPVMGGLLACDGQDRPVKHGDAMDEREAREATKCAVCDPTTGPAACAAEIARLRSRDGFAEVARYIETIHVTRCRVP